MDKGCGGTNMLGRQFTRGEPGGGRGSRVTIRLGMGKQAYIGRGYNLEGIHKNTRRIAHAGGGYETGLPNLWGGREEFVW